MVPVERDGQKIESRRLRIIDLKATPNDIDRTKNASIAEGTLNVSSNVVTDSYAAPYLLSLGASASSIGFLSFAQNLANVLAQLPGSKLTMYMSRKKIWVISELLSDLAIIPIILLPLITQNPVIPIIIFLAFAAFVTAMRGPSWTSLMGDVIPKNTWNSYFAKRNTIVGFSEMLSIFVIGLILTYTGFNVIFTISILTGLISILFFIRMYEPPFNKRFKYQYAIPSSIEKWGLLIKSNRNLVVFTAFLTYLNIAIEIIDPFIVVYLLHDLNFTYMEFAAVLAIGLFAKTISHRYWGRISGKFGDMKVMAITGILVAFVPLWYIFANNFYEVALVRIFTGFAWAGFNLMSFTFLLNMTPRSKRPEYVGGHRFFTGIGGIIGALIGSIIVTEVRKLHLFWLAGLQVMFLISFILRGSSLAFLARIKYATNRDEYPLRYAFWNSVAFEPYRSVKGTTTGFWHGVSLNTRKFSRKFRVVGRILSIIIAFISVSLSLPGYHHHYRQYATNFKNNNKYSYGSSRRKGAAAKLAERFRKMIYGK